MLLFVQPYFPFADIDAAGKPHSGILRGNIGWLGSYSECLAISDAKYCVSQINLHYPTYNIVCNHLNNFLLKLEAPSMVVLTCNGNEGIAYW